MQAHSAVFSISGMKLLSCFIVFMFFCNPAGAHDIADDIDSMGAKDVAILYLELGFKHILPLGMDHILFILGLYLLNPRLKPVLLQATAFTIAHSITLGLAMYKVVEIPASIVEPVIALSILFVAIENICTGK